MQLNGSDPYLTGKVTYGFRDIGSRNNMELKPEDVMVTIPMADLERILMNLKEMQTKTFFKKKIIKYFFNLLSVYQKFESIYIDSFYTLDQQSY